MIGDEARAQILEREGRLPDRVVACVGGGSNAIGTFAAFVDDPDVALLGVEAAGEGLDTGRHGAPLTVGGRPGVLHGALIALLQTEEGQILEAHSVSAGLDYPGAGPEHAWLRDSGRATLRRGHRRRRRSTPCATSPGSRGSSRRWRPRTRCTSCCASRPSSTLDLVCLSGRGDKDLAEVMERLDAPMSTRGDDRRRGADRRARSRRAASAPR